MNLVMIETLFSLCFPCFTRNLGYNVRWGERILIEKLRGAARERIRRWNFDTSQLSVRSVVESGGAPRNILSSFLMMLKRLVNTVFVLFAGVERRM